MQEVIKEYLESAKFGRKQVYKNMAVFPLLSECALALEYMLLDEALGAGLVEVTEVDNQGAAPNLKVHNKSPSMAMAGIYEKDLSWRLTGKSSTCPSLRGRGTARKGPSLHGWRGIPEEDGIEYSMV